MQPARLLPSVLLASLLAPSAAAQIEHGGVPPSTYLDVASEVPTVAMAPVDVEALLLEDAAAGKDGPFRFGAELAVDFGLADAGLWEEIPGGGRLWRVRVLSEGAHSLSFVFSRYAMAPGAELYVYPDDMSVVLGKFDWKNEKPNGQMAVQPVPGEAVVLEYFEPLGVERAGELRIGTVVHDYVDVISILAEEPLDTHCEIDVNCPVGAPWQNQIRATTLIVNGGILCSGSLLNNTAFDGTQLFISANHCGVLNNAVFRFKYQNSGCGTGSAPTGMTVQGSTQLATHSGIDFRLVRILPQIPASYEPYFAGWDRSGAFPTNTVTVHHPGGGPKKISFDDDSPGKSGTDWRIFQWELGVTEPGSSGCPLYDQNGRFIGQLWGGAAACGFPFDDFYGRLDAEWSLVAPHLDPLGTGAFQIDGFDPSGGPGGPQITSITPSTVDALIPGTEMTVAIEGSGFSPATTVSVDGVLLTGIPSPYAVVSSAKIVMDMPLVDKLGTVDVKVSNASGEDTAQMTVAAPALPKLQAGSGDEPVSLFSFVGLDLTMSSQPNDLFLLFWSPSGSPSVAPGIVSMEIGAGFASLFQLGTWTIDPTKAWTSDHVSLAGVPPFTTFHLEGVVVRATGLAFPLDTSEAQECQVIF